MNAIKVKLHEGGCMPERHGAFYDLATRREEKLEKGELRILPLGVSIVLPEGSWGLVVPRSSTCLKHGIMLANSAGVIENDYCGDDDEWGFPAYAVRDTVIPAGTRIAQWCAMPLMPDAKLEQVASTGRPNRGGWGSTGEKAASAVPKPLDYDGVEIKVGDIIYFVNGSNDQPYGEGMRVSAVRDDVYLRFDDYSGVYSPGMFTHREPDSWEKLLADAKAGEYSNQAIGGRRR